MNFKRLLLTGIVAAATCDLATAGIFECCDLRSCGESCCPTIARPCHVNIHNYQRGASCLSSHCTSESACCVSEGCGPCCSAPQCCAPQCCAPECSAPQCSAPQWCAPECSVPTVGATCCVPTETQCTPAGCGEGCCSSACSECFCSCRGDCRSAEVCREINRLICESKSGGYARERREAIHKLGDRYDCCCHPHIMTAFIYALNDTDERVRAKAADEIGDQVRRKRVRIGSPVVCALQRSLADHDRMVRRQAEQALRASGYKIVDGCCQSYCPPAQHSTVHQYDSPIPDGSLTPVPGPEHDAGGPDGTADDPSTDGRTDDVPAPPETNGVEDVPELSPSAPSEADNSYLPKSAPEWDDEPSDEFSPLPRKINHVSFTSRLRDFRDNTPQDNLSTLIGPKHGLAKTPFEQLLHNKEFSLSPSKRQ